MFPQNLLHFCLLCPDQSASVQQSHQTASYNQIQKPHRPSCQRIISSFFIQTTIEYVYINIIMVSIRIFINYLKLRLCPPGLPSPCQTPCQSGVEIFPDFPQLTNLLQGKDLFIYTFSKISWLKWTLSFLIKDKNDTLHIYWVYKINHLSAVASESHLGKAVRLLCRDLEEIFEFLVLVYFCFVFEVVEQRHGGFLFSVCCFCFCFWRCWAEALRNC